jgi:signal transduction histidine kinase
METSGEVRLTPSEEVLRTMARTLRHEVGDLLQTVYSTVAILHERIPAEQGLERRLLTDLKSRAENCKHELDAVVDLVCPVHLNPAPVDLSELASGLTASFSKRYPALQVRNETAGPVPVLADARRLAQVGPLLLLSACQAAQRQVWVRTRRDPATGEAELSVTNDGPPATAEQLVWLTDPFTTTHHAQFGLGLALARRIVALHGGRVAAENLPEGGFRVRLVLPPSPPQG